MEGYAQIAARISVHPELGIYRRFSALNAQNILYLQAELHELEADLKQYAQEDYDAGILDKTSAQSQYSRNWRKLAKSTNDDRRQWNTVLAIREKLKEYNDVLAQQVLITNGYRSPKSYDLDILRACLNGQGSAYPDYLLGLDSTIWDKNHGLDHDLITLTSASALSSSSGAIAGGFVGTSTGDDDAFTTFIAAYIVGPFHQLIGRHVKKPAPDLPGMTEYSDRAIARFASLIATVISSVFPIVGVIILYFVKDTLARIGIIAALTALFSLCLALITSAKKSEIFAATAAFSAVLVVFLGTGTNGPVPSMS